MNQPVAPVAVVGYGLAVPGASSPAELWSVLQEDVPRFALPERFDIEVMHVPGEDVPDRVRSREGGFIRGFRPHPRVAAELAAGRWQPSDTETTWLRHSLLQAMEGCAPPRRPACYVGAWTGGSMAIDDGLLCASVARELAALLSADEQSARTQEKRLRTLLEERFRCAPADLRHVLPHEIVRRAFAGLLPAGADWLTLGAACASSLSAIDLGIQSLYEGTCEVAFCGGVNAVGRSMTLTADKFHGVSPSADVRAFDAAADGTVFSDGAAVLALKLPERAATDGDRVLGLLTRPGLSVDGKGRSIAAPNPGGHRMALRRGWRDGGVGRVDWVIAHGTGTAAGDAAEIEVLAEAAGSSDLVCTSNKPIVGHTGWVSGTVSVIHALLALEHETIPAARRFAVPAPALAETRLVLPPRDVPWPSGQGPRTAGVSSLGLGGVNGHVVVHDVLTDDAEPPAADDDPMVLVGWSARVPGEGDEEAVARWLRTGDGPPPARFGEHYQGPPIQVSRISPTVTDVLDRGQQLALDVTGRLVARHGELWADLRDTTGVIGAQSGVPRALHDTIVRSAAAELEALFPEGGDRRALSDYLDRVRARQKVTDVSFVGTAPSLAVNWITNRWDLHGTALTIDKGADSAGMALRTARRYLADRRLDLALVLALNANAEQEASWCTGREGLAEGAFLLALTRRSFAEGRGWPYTELPEDPAPATAGHDYYGAQGVVDLLRATLNGGAVTDGVQRWATALRRTEPPAGTGPVALPRGCVVLAGSASLAQELAAASRAAGALLLTGPDGLDLIGGDRTHLRVVTRTAGALWPEEAPEHSRLLELALQCVQRMDGRLESAVALVLDPQEACLPHPESALFTGFFRSLALEQPGGDVFALVTDAGPIEGLEQLGTVVDRPPVVYFRQGARYTEELCPMPLPAAESVELGENPVIVAVGGGRGITNTVLRALARQVRPSIWVLGRTNPADVPPEILGAPDADHDAARRDFLLARRTSGRPADLARAFERHWQARQLIRDLDDLREHCAHVEYLACDVTDRSAVNAAVDAVGRPVDLLIHAARFQETATAAGKTLAGFRTCLDTKVKAYRNLRAAFAGRRPRIWINFGSAVSALGLPGETDYTAANEFLAAAARHESRLSGHRELTLGWGLWEESGSASGDQIREMLTAQGFAGGVSDSEGVALFLADLAAGRTAEPAPVFVTSAQAGSRSDGPGPLGEPEPDGQWRLVLDPSRDRYLAEHLVDGRPALPGAVMVALAAEAALRVSPDARVKEVCDVSFEEFVWIGHGKYRIRAESVAASEVAVEFLSDVVNERTGEVVRHDRRHARMVVKLGDPGPPPAFAAGTGSMPYTVDDPYCRPGADIQLTGAFRNVFDIAWGREAAQARWRPIPADGRTRVPAFLLDALFRLSVLPDVIELKAPVRISRIRLYDPGSDGEVAARCPSGAVLRRDFAGNVYTAAEPGGRVLLTVEGLETAGYGRPLKPRDLPCYEWHHAVMFGETSAVGIVYYAELLNWIGHCREQWAFETFPVYMRGLMTGRALMVTDEISLKYLGEMWANDRITIRMRVPWVRMHHMYGTFTIHRHTPGGEQLVAKGWQTWANCTPGGEGEIEPAPWQQEVLSGLTAMGTDISRAWAEGNETMPSDAFASARREE
ncbi:beta-ketoacyl synthase N-terminal-like domain-containing protein [Nonomuraea sp. NPDC050556]|uniref:beta-ketoacyl synthase N-terminal-like domain-containing protein n=1 Tax=Nonomuraea sp. NPDC050556 TaxID=3364369 RepID=UPI00378A1DF4